MNTITRALPVASVLAARGSWMTPLGVLSATVMAHGQTSQFQTISLDGARTLLHAAEQKAQQLSAPSSLAVVDGAGDLILFEQMEGARRIGVDLAVGKARSAARFQATQTLEAGINGGRSAAITAGAIQMDGGVPIRIGGRVVGAVGVSGLDHHNDIKIAEAAAAAVTQEFAR
jgi:glc operon protein GlcG